MRVLLAVLLIGIAGCGGEDNSPDDVAVPPSPVKATGIEDLSDAELADLLQELTEDPADVPLDQSGDDAVAALKKLGARIKQDDQGEVVEVRIASTKVTDADLVHLKGLTNLQSLVIGSFGSQSQITDAGLVHLKGLTNLHTLRLVQTQVTDAGLVHLKGLTNLEHLDLTNTKVTDAGLVHLVGLTKLEGLELSRTPITDARLVHLRGLTKLEWLYLEETQVTDTGVAELQKALPNCEITKPSGAINN